MSAVYLHGSPCSSVAVINIRLQGAHYQSGWFVSELRHIKDTPAGRAGGRQRGRKKIKINHTGKHHKNQRRFTRVADHSWQVRVEPWKKQNINTKMRTYCSSATFSCMTSILCSISAEASPRSSLLLVRSLMVLARSSCLFASAACESWGPKKTKQKNPKQTFKLSRWMVF